MAGEIAHIVLADKMLTKKYFHSFEHSSFFVGAVFPDIRYLRVIARNKTHYGEIRLSDVLREKDSFASGVQFHSLVDLVLETFIIKSGIYNRIPRSPYISLHRQRQTRERYLWMR